GAARTLVQAGVADPVAATVARRDHFGIRMPLRAVFQQLVEGQRVGLHRPVDHGHPGPPWGSGGAITPTFQCQGNPPCARRRQTTVSTSSYMPGIRCSPGTGTASKAM